jgi:hypothetical protein
MLHPQTSELMHVIYDYLKFITSHAEAPTDGESMALKMILGYLSSPTKMKDLFAKECFTDTVKDGPLLLLYGVWGPAPLQVCRPKDLSDLKIAEYDFRLQHSSFTFLHLGCEQ